MMTNLILAIDPGPEKCGVVIYDADEHKLVYSNDEDTNFLLQKLRNDGFYKAKHFVCEDIVSYGMAVGRSTFDTCKVIGRIQEILYAKDEVLNLIGRRDVKTVLAGGSTYRCPETGARKAVNDSIIKSIIKSRFPEDGGGKNPVVGTKKQPGPIYGLKGHAWQALAIALVFSETVYDYKPFFKKN